MFDIHISEVLAAVDELEPSQYTQLQMTEWLSELDGQIFEEVIKTHVPDRHWKGHVWRGDPLNQGIEGVQYERPLPPDAPTDEDGNPMPPPDGERWHWPYISVDDLLIAGPPYGKEMYVHYLQSKIAYHNAEQAKYSIFAAAYNNSFLNFANWYNRNHMPRMEKGGNRWKF